MELAFKQLDERHKNNLCSILEQDKRYENGNN